MTPPVGEQLPLLPEEHAAYLAFKEAAQRLADLDAQRKIAAQELFRVQTIWLQIIAPTTKEPIE